MSLSLSTVTKQPQVQLHGALRVTGSEVQSELGSVGIVMRYRGSIQAEVLPTGARADSMLIVVDLALNHDG